PSSAAPSAPNVTCTSGWLPIAMASPLAITSTSPQQRCFEIKIAGHDTHHAKHIISWRHAWNYRFARFDHRRVEQTLAINSQKECDRGQRFLQSRLMERGANPARTVGTHFELNPVNIGSRHGKGPPPIDPMACRNELESPGGPPQKLKISRRIFNGG